jgi:3-oxoacyl-[acyl-carrier-protein] synthase II
VVTGFGAVTPLGLTAADLWEGLVAGRSGIGFVTTFDTEHFPVKVAGEVKGLPTGKTNEVSRTHQLLRLALREALDHSALGASATPVRLGVFCGRSLDWPTPAQVMVANGFDIVDRRFGATAPLLAGVVSQTVRTTTVRTQTLDGACASGGMVVGQAFRSIRDGRVDAAVAAGASSWTNLLGISVYHKLNALSLETRVPAEASRPFDARRSGFVMAEGAGVLILESLEHALWRGALPLAEITGYGATASAYRVTDLPTDAEPQATAIRAALADAGTGADDVTYINAHGTSTYQNDLIETRALHKAFGKHARDLAISSNKSMLGHTITAAGVLEAVATVCTINAGLIPPTINLNDPDPSCDLDYVPHQSRQSRVEVAVSTSFGFGGQNCALVLEAYRSQRIPTHVL